MTLERDEVHAQGIRLRAGLEAKFLREVDPTTSCPKPSGAAAPNRSEAYYQRLALTGAKARRPRHNSKKAAAKTAAAEPDRGSAV